jgi:excinuclease UvrABC nuclease subunit
MIFVDTAEPDDIIKFIKQSVPVEVGSLNQKSIADYFFIAADGHRVQVNRTQAGELLGNIDSFEDELRRYYNSAEETYAIIEGVISPYKITGGKMPSAISAKPNAPPGSLYAYSVSDKGFIYKERAYNVSNKMLKSWLMQIDKCGITVFYTVNYADTAAALVAFYDNLQKTEHSTLQRYIKPHIIVRSHNPHVQALVNLSQAYRLDIGEVKAEALIERFESLGRVLLAEVGELCTVEGIGQKTAEKLLQVIGE